MPRTWQDGRVRRRTSPSESRENWIGVALLVSIGVAAWSGWAFGVGAALLPLVGAGVWAFAVTR